MLSVGTRIAQLSDGKQMLYRDDVIAGPARVLIGSMSVGLTRNIDRSPYHYEECLR